MTDEIQCEVAPTDEELNTPEHLQKLYGVDLSLLGSGGNDVPQLPLDVFGFWARWLETAATDAGAPVDYVAMSMLAGAAAVTGNARWVAGAAGGWFTDCGVLWVALVGPPSHGKTPGASAVINALKIIDREELIAFEPERTHREEAATFARATEAAWREAVTAAVRSGDAPPSMPPDAVALPPAIAPQILVGDVTGEALVQIVAASPRGVLIHRDELAGLVGGLDRYRGGGSDRAMLLEGYGGQAFRVSRKGGGATNIPHLSVGILGGLQPDKFQSLIGKSDDDGFQARFLYVFPLKRPFAGRPTKRTDQARLIDAFRRLRGLQMGDAGDGPIPVNIPLDDVASDGFEAWMKQRDAEAPLGTHRFQAWCGKAPGRVLRLALVLTLLEWAFEGVGHPPQVIRDEAVQRAIWLHDCYLTDHARKTFADAALPEAERHARTIARWLASHAGENEPYSVTVREIYRHRHLGIRTRDEAYAALQVLVDAGWLKPAPSRAGEHPGRRSERFEIPDGLWTCFAELGGTCG